MDEVALVRLPVADEVAEQRTWAEVLAAVALVAEGEATQVALTNLTISDGLAGAGAALAQRAGVAFIVEQAVTGRREIRVGPRITG
jgi:hypothetical protein